MRLVPSCHIQKMLTKPIRFLERFLCNIGWPLFSAESCRRPQREGVLPRTNRSLARPVARNRWKAGKA